MLKSHGKTVQVCIPNPYFDNDQLEYVSRFVPEPMSILILTYAHTNPLPVSMKEYQIWKETKKIKHDPLPQKMIDFFLHHWKPIDVPLTTLEQKLGSLVWSQLKDFQREGVQFLVERHGRGLLGDDQGLGKTRQALAALLYFRPKSWPTSKTPLHVYCPKTAIGAWQDTIQQLMGKGVKMFLPEKSSDILYYSTQPKMPDLADIWIMTYDILSRNEEVLKLFTKWRPVAILADECHKLQKRGSRRTKAVTKLVMRAKHAILLSGTSFSNFTADGFSLFRMLQPLLFDGFFDPHKEHSPQFYYAWRYCDPKAQKFGHKIQWEFKGGKRLAELHALQRVVFTVRRKKEQVLSLPTKERIPISFRFPDEVMDPWMVELREIRQQYQNDPEQARVRFLRLYHAMGTAKVPYMVQFMEGMLLHGHFAKDSRSKWILFATHHAMMDALEATATKHGMEIIRIDGQTKGKDRQAQIDRFQQVTGGPRIAILSLMAAAEACTLTRANMVWMTELHFNPSLLLQAEDRAHRIGQERPVAIYYFKAEETVEEVIWNMLNRKLKQTSTIMDGEQVSMAQLMSEIHLTKRARIETFPPVRE